MPIRSRANYEITQKRVVQAPYRLDPNERPPSAMHQTATERNDARHCSDSAGELRYLREARRRHAYREVFLTSKAPVRPLSASAISTMVSDRFHALGIRSLRSGPHALRHACARRLVAQGHSLKEIGDHLGHRSAYSTRTYAKVDLAGLREVADLQQASQCLERYAFGGCHE